MPLLTVKLISMKDEHIIEAKLTVGELDSPSTIAEKLDAFSKELFRNRNVAEYTMDSSAVTAYMEKQNHAFTELRMS